MPAHIPCPHLEKLLAGPRKRCAPAVRVPNIDELPEYVSDEDGKARALDWERLLDKMHTSQEERALLTHKFVHGLSYKQIKEEEGYTSKGAVGYHLTLVCEELRRRGITYNTTDRVPFRPGARVFKKRDI